MCGSHHQNSKHLSSESRMFDTLARVNHLRTQICLFCLFVTNFASLSLWFDRINLRVILVCISRTKRGDNGLFVVFVSLANHKLQYDTLISISATIVRCQRLLNECFHRAHHMKVLSFSLCKHTETYRHTYEHARTHATCGFIISLFFFLLLLVHSSHVRWNWWFMVYACHNKKRKKNSLKSQMVMEIIAVTTYSICDRHSQHWTHCSCANVYSNVVLPIEKKNSMKLNFFWFTADCARRAKCKQVVNTTVQYWCSCVRANEMKIKVFGIIYSNQ